MDRETESEERRLTHTIVTSKHLYLNDECIKLIMNVFMLNVRCFEHVKKCMLFNKALFNSIHTHTFLLVKLS